MTLSYIILFEYDILKNFIFQYDFFAISLNFSVLNMRNYSQKLILFSFYIIPYKYFCS
jgi:hypothetical protein